MEELDDIKPQIGDNGKRNPFVVPEGYFEGFSGRLQERMGTEGVPAGIRAGRKILRPAFAYIAGVAFVIIIGIYLARIILVPHPLNVNSETNLTNLVQYSLENIDEQTIIEGLPNNEKDTASSEITRDDIINYIQDHNIDLNSLNEEL